MMIAGPILGAILLIGAILVGALSIPMARGRLPMSRMYGARYPKSFESEENWIRINVYTGRRFLAWSAVLAGLAIVCFFLNLGARPILALLLASAPLLYVIPCWQGWKFSQRL